MLKSTIKDSVPKSMINGHTTTYKERIEIVQYTIANELNYAQAIEKYYGFIPTSVFLDKEIPTTRRRSTKRQPWTKQIK